MTYDELDAIPERPVGVDWLLMSVDGTTIKIPCMPSVRAIFREANDPVEIADREGRWWTIGRDHGLRYKQRLPMRSE